MMKPGNFHRPERGALEIIEEAGQLLRMAPVGIFFQYYLGTLPFVLAFIFFWIDMSSSGAAGPHLVHESLGMAALFVWMKCWQAVFASRLRSFLEDARQSAWNVGRIARLVCIQSVIMPWMMILLPLALVICLPFGWVYAFFQNMAVFGDGAQEQKTCTRRAWQQSILWPWQNHKILLICLLFSTFVFLNICMVAYLFPQILRMFLGIETVFSRNSFFFLNTTFLVSMAGITYLCVNPLIRAAYVLRCFYGESLSSGRDLLSEWRRLHRNTYQVLVLIIAIPIFTMFLPGCLHAAPGTPSVEISVPAGQDISPDISPQKLDRAISDVIAGVEYSWRFPRDKKEDPKESGFVGQVTATVGGWLKIGWNSVTAAWDWLVDWLTKLGPEEQPKTPTGFNISGKVKLWLTLLLVAVALAAVWQLRNFRLRGKKGAVIVKEAPPALSKADLSDENISADQLPEVRWLALARSLLQEGELRFALRAFYFAALAHLAEQNLLTLSRFKSNRDYEREIKRRAHAFPGLIGAFSENITILERIWYGMHSVRQETVQQFLNNYERITADEQGR
jgi:hypothetical protein